MADLKFIDPRDGDMLSDVSGKVNNGVLEIEVELSGREDCPVWVNGTAAKWENDCYVANVPLTGYSNTLIAKDAEGAEQSIVIYWLKNAANKYSLSVDDNIFFLADLTQNQGKYQSIFDNAYLNVYKRAHDQYGAKVRINLFYNLDNKYGKELYGDFNLSMMTDKYKDEFQANSHWLHFGFHAYQEFPAWPYREATGERVIQDYELIAREVKRFAGEGMLENATTNHYGSGNREVIRAERKMGVFALMGCMELNDGEPHVSYYMDKEQIIHSSQYGVWKDHSEDMIFGKLDIFMNNYDCQQIRDILDEAKARYPKKGMMEIMIHEQYFYHNYIAYLPDFDQRVFTGCQWCVEHGYTPAFTSEILGK